MGNLSLDKTGFECTLRDLGFDAPGERTLAANASTPPHVHDFDVRALVLDGEIALAVGGVSTRYGVGEVFTMDRGRAHAETVGPKGVTYLVGRRTG